MIHLAQQSHFWAKKLESYSDPEKLKEKLETKPYVTKCRIREIFKLIAAQKSMPEGALPRLVHTTQHLEREPVARFISSVEAAGVFRNKEYLHRNGGHNLLSCIGDADDARDAALAEKLLHLGCHRLSYGDIKVGDLEDDYKLSKVFSDLFHKGNGYFAFMMLDYVTDYSRIPLTEACEKGNLDFCFEVLRREASPSSKNSGRAELLDTAAQKGYESLVSYLIQSRRFTFKDHIGTLLGFYCKNNLKGLAVQHIHDEGIKESELCQGLSSAICTGHFDIVELILDKIRQDRSNTSYQRSVNFSLKSACEKGISEGVELLLATGMVTRYDFNLSKFCKQGDFETVKRLLDHAPSEEARRALLDYKDCYGKNLLMLAAESGSEPLFSLLLEEGLSVMEVSKEKTALTFAVKNEHLIIVERILSLVPEEEIKEYVNPGVSGESPYLNGGSPLWMACYKGRVEIAKKLLEFGATTGQDLDGVCLSAVARRDNIDIAKIVIQQILQMDLENQKKYIRNLFNNACRSGGFEVARLLLESCTPVIADLLAEGTASKSLYYASENGMTNIVDQLLHLIPTEKKQEFINLGWAGTPLTEACENNHEEVVQLLLEHGADVQLSCHGMTPLYYAIQTGNLSIVRAILNRLDEKERIQYINAKHSREGLTALELTVRLGNADIAHLLIDAGADMSQVHAKGAKLLYKAAKRDFLGIVELIQETCKPDEFMEYMEFEHPIHKQTPLATAIENENAQVAEFLIDAGADVTKLASDGQSLYELACDKKLGAVAKQILEKLKVYYLEGVTDINGRKIIYPTSFFQKSSLYGNNQVLTVSNGKIAKDFFINTQVVSAASGYFHSLFNSKFKESKEAQLVFEGFEPSTFESVLQYIYTGRVDLSHDNVKELVEMSNEFLLTELQKKLRLWILRHPECSNWMKKLQLLDERGKPLGESRRIIGACSSS